MRRFVCLLAALVLVAPAVSFADLDYAVGGGALRGSADASGGGDVDSEGLFVTFNGQMENGLIFRISISDSDESGGGVSDDLMRTDFSAGWMFRRDATVRPFVHGGLSRVSLEETVLGVTVLDGSSTVITLGGGLEAGTGHHNFYFDFNLDPGHEVDFTAAPGSADFDLNEIHAGYLYRF